MGQGETNSPSRRALRMPGAAALLALAAAVGCGDDATRPATDDAPIPPYWQGAAAPGTQPWATTGQWTAAPPTMAPSPAPWSTPYAASPAMPAPTATASVAPAPLPHFAEPAPQTLVWPESPAESAKPIEPAAAAAVAPAPAPAVGVLLAPREAPAAEPAPVDVVVLDDMPTLEPPTPEALDRLAAEVRRAAGAATETASAERVPITAAAPAETASAVPPPVALARAVPAPVSPVTPTVPTMAPPPSEAAPTGAVVNQRATERIRRGHELAERGATFAARAEFLAVLRMIAEAKDDRFGAPRRTIALADGLRALDEAADFAVDGSHKTSDLSISVIVASHRTPVAKEFAVDGLLPQQLAEMYFRYAQVQLAAAVAGEPAGSMALHALGKLSSLMGRVEPQQNPQADRRAFALQQAALLARSDNHLAAHELGVLLAEAGHLAESQLWLRQVAAQAPHPVVFRNLARIERQLGRADLATMSERQADFLASRGAGGHPNVQWVAANSLAQTPDAMGPGATPTLPQQVPMTARGPAPVIR